MPQSYSHEETKRDQQHKAGLRALEADYGLMGLLGLVTAL